MQATLDHVHVEYPEPHLQRTRKILAAHPEIKRLFGNNPRSAWLVAGIVAAQIALALALAHSPWWAILLAAYTVGAVADHALWVLIHDCTHNLAFKTSAGNCWLAIGANLPIVFPSAMSFRIYHIKHHLYQGDLERDADLPRPFEARFVGNSSFRKAVWFFFFFASQLVRVPFLKGIEFFNRWVLANIVVQVTFLGLMFVWGGWGALAYLLAATVFSIGLHPLGARWIQEHYIVHEKQETYSYYGPLNLVALNVGYHNEHHDFMKVAWNRLPEIRATAPEFYDTLYWHRSWTGLLLRFIFDPKMSLFSRVVRPHRSTIRPASHEQDAGMPAAAPLLGAVLES
jgi:sphingolipid delta-4 desaturase